MSGDMAYVSPTHRDPLISPYFKVSINGALDGKVEAYFKECSAIGSENPVISTQVDRGAKKMTQKQPGLTKYNDVTLKRGVTEDLGFWTWRQQIIDGQVNKARASGTISLYNQMDTLVASWNFKEAWPSKITGPSFNATGNEIAVEEVTIVFESMTREN
jgi:phage tail-like protein